VAQPAPRANPQPNVARPAAPKPATPNVAKPAAPKPATPNVGKPATPKPATPDVAKPATPKPATPGIAKPATPKPATPDVAKPNRPGANANANATARANTDNKVTVRRPVVDNFNNNTKVTNNIKAAAANTNVASNTRLNAAVANPNNPRHWSNWNRNWNNYGVAPWQRSWYQGAWGGFNGPGFYTPFGFGYGGGGYGYGSGFGLGNLGLGYGYNGLGGLGYGLGGFGGNGFGGGGYGLNPWLLNSLGYQWGYYGGFNNPYYASSYSMPYNYSRPVYLTYYDDNRSAPPAAADDVNDARVAFRNGEYEKAIDLLDHAIKANPSDTAAHELRALSLFALGRYEESAATLNALLAVAPGWNWETMSGLYPSVNTYTKQLRDLEAFTKEKPDNPAGRFVLGYHYLVAGHTDAAKKQFEKVVDLQPKDRVAQQLLAGLEKDDKAAVSQPPPEPAKERFRDGEETDLVGKWMAKGDKAPPVELQLTDDGKFHWVAGDGKNAAEVEGKYEVEGQTMTLDGGKNESLVGHLASEGKDRFHFKLLGSPPDDPGLDFERAR